VDIVNLECLISISNVVTFTLRIIVWSLNKILPCRVYPLHLGNEIKPVISRFTAKNFWLLIATFLLLFNWFLFWECYLFSVGCWIIYHILNIYRRKKRKILVQDSVLQLRNISGICLRIRTTHSWVKLANQCNFYNFREW